LPCAKEAVERFVTAFNMEGQKLEVDELTGHKNRKVGIGRTRGKSEWELSKFGRSRLGYGKWMETEDFP
jgi:hypothetical protein